MIDTFALALGHGLLAIAMLRLVMRAGLDEDPLIGSIEAEAASNRKAASVSGRNAARRSRGANGAAAEDEDKPGATGEAAR